MIGPIKRLLVDLWGRRRDDFDWRVYQKPLDLDAVESVLVLQLNDKLGDALMISLLVDALARARPDLRVAVGTTPGLVEYWQRNPLVAEVVPLSCSRKLGRTMGRRIRDARRTARPGRGRFEVAVSFEPYAVPDHFALLRALAPRVVIGFNKNPYRLFDYSLDERRHGVVASPVAERTARVMEVFGRAVDCRTLRFSAPIGVADVHGIQRTLDRLPPGPRLLLNVYGHGDKKHLTPDSVATVVSVLREAGHGGPIFVSVPFGEEARYEAALPDAILPCSALAVIPPMPDLFKLFALVNAMDAVVSPDTAVGHVAAALDKPQVVIFAENGTIPVAWKPYSRWCRSVLSQSGTNVNDLDWGEFEAAARWLVGEEGREPPAILEPGIP